MPSIEHNQGSEDRELARLVVFRYTTTDRPGETHTLLTHGFDLDRAVKWCRNVHGERVVEVWES